MPYISRNENGEIIEIKDSASEQHTEWLDSKAPEIVAFLKGVTSPEHAKKALNETDNEMVRVVEDLVDMLMEKQVFIFTELPEAVQAKLNARKQLRKDINALENLINEDDAIF